MLWGGLSEVRIPAGTKGLLSSPNCPNWPWGQPGFPHNRYQGFLRWEKWPACEVDHSLPSSADVKWVELYLCSLIYLHDMDGDNWTFTFIMWNCGGHSTGAGSCLRASVPTASCHMSNVAPSSIARGSYSRPNWTESCPQLPSVSCMPVKNSGAYYGRILLDFIHSMMLPVA